MRPGGPKASALAWDGMLAALPIAAGATLLAARWLPVRFSYRPNALGIVSVASELRYPLQQETFWLVFALAFGSVAALGLARWLGRERLSGERAALAEACGAASLAALLFLPTALGVAAALAAVVAARAAAGPRGLAASPGATAGPRGLAASPGATAGPRGLAASPRAASAVSGGPARERGGWCSAAWGLALLALALLLTPSLFVNAWNVAHAVADERRTLDAFTFQGEIGQHLAWADALRRGLFHGRDFFCLYGPLYDLGAVGIWALVGRSIAAWELYFSLTRALGLAALLGLAASLCSRRVFVLVIPFLVPWVNLRIGLALGALALLFAWLRSGRRSLAAAAGGLTGAALLYSQEFGLAAALTSAVGLALRRDARASLAWLAAVAAATTPLLAWYAANGALGPMLRDLVAYPRYVLAGFGKLPFPSLAASLPLAFESSDAQGGLLLRLGYAVPAVAWGALLLALPFAALELRRPLASGRRMLDALRGDPERTEILACGLFGLLCFRTALGRSDLIHVVPTLAPTALLLALACDRLYSGWRERRTPGRLVAWRASALVVFAAAAGLAEAPRPLREATRTLSDVATLRRHGHEPFGSRAVMRVVRWLQLRAEPDDAILFLPNDAAYYYLLDRPSPIRFVMGHQIATDAHRREVLEALRREPPRFVVWDHGALRVDDLPDERVFGPELLRWIDEGYVERTRLGEVSVLERRPPGEVSVFERRPPGARP